MFKRGVKPTEIAFVSYTNAACDEARDRACEKFGLTRRDFPYFSTIHSLSIGSIPKAARPRVRTNKDYREIGRRTSLPVTLNYNANLTDAGSGSPSKGDLCIRLIGQARAREHTLRDVCFEAENADEMYRSRISLDDVERFEAELKAYKREEGCTDFDDMLERGAEADPLDVRYAIIDEAQDLSLSQWRACDNLFQFAETVYIAGDDDQAIFDFAGGCSEIFREMGERLEDSRVILAKSWRCPTSVMSASQAPLHRLHDRVPKEAKPRDEKGTIEVVAGLKSVDFSEGEWLILVRQHSHAQEAYSQLRDLGYAYTKTTRGSSVTGNQKKLIATHEALRNGKIISPAAVIAYYGCLDSKTQLKHGHKTTIERKISQQRRKGPLDAQNLIDNFGLLPHVLEESWFEALHGIDVRQRNYIRQTLQNKEFYLTDPRIRVSTIHSAKGSECDNVVIIPTLSYRQINSIQRYNRDVEYRVAYVAMTRARKRLFIANGMADNDHTWFEYFNFLKSVLDEDQKHAIITPQLESN